MVKLKKISKAELAKINQQILEDISLFQKTLHNLSYDIPLEALCLPKNIECILVKNKIYRVVDLMNTDYKKIKGLGSVKANVIQFCLSRTLGL